MADANKPILLTRSPSDEEKWQLVQRVAASVAFQKATRLREFLLFVCDRTLKNQLEDVRESNIGCAVFGRGLDYNPAEDNIVRVEARHLRKRLADYFAAEGKDEPFVIVIPKGSYAASFVRRDKVQPEDAQPSDVAVPGPADPQVGRVPAGEPQQGTERPHFRTALVAVACILAAVSIFLFVQNRQLRSQAGNVSQELASSFPWTSVLNGRQTKIVLADSCLALLDDVMHRQIDLNEYVTRGYLGAIAKYDANPELRSVLGVIASRQYTSLADVGFVGTIMRLTTRYRGNIALSYARNLDIRDFKTAGNFILVGSPRANPWVELFEPKLKHRFEFDTALKQPLFRNKWPQPGEPKTYLTGGADGKSSDSYAVVALVPNLNNTGNVLIIEGTNMEGTEAGVEFLTDPAFEDKTVRALGIKSLAKPYFEILLKLRTVGGTSENAQPLSQRAIQ